MKVTDILKCPKTGNKLQFIDSDSKVAVENTDITYFVKDGIIDFCTEVRDKVSVSYDGFASSYDTYFTSSSLSMKLFNRLVCGNWNYSDYAETMLSYLPSRFDGVLLDVPAGTGLLTASLYAQYPNATIIAVDYSIGMLKEAKKRFEKQGLNNVRLIRADVGSLPVKDASVDIVLSLAGLHAFPDKQAAVSEMGRVLNPDGSLIASCYVKGDSFLFDWGVKVYGIRKGFFNPPLFTIDEIGSYLEGFNIKRQEHIKSGVYFEAVRVSSVN